MKNISKDLSIIDKGLTIDGMVSSQGKLLIKGTVKGTLLGDTVIIAKEGTVSAETKATNITIGGTFEGKIRASDKLVILATGQCSGKVICKNFVVEAGGVLNAEVNCITTQDAKNGKGILAPLKSA